VSHYPDKRSFYAADERRGSSAELFYGEHWSEGGRCSRPICALYLIVETGEFYTLATTGSDQRPLGSVELLCRGLSPRSAERALSGWETVQRQDHSMRWLRQRLRPYMRSERVGGTLADALRGREA